MNVHDSIQKIIELETQYSLLQLLHPINEEAEREKFLSGETKEPIFHYETVTLPTETCDDEVEDSSLSALYRDRISHTKMMLELVSVRGNDEEFSLLSQKLFPLRPLLETTLPSLPPPLKEREGFDVLHIREKFLSVLEALGLIWTVEISSEITSRILVISPLRTIILREGLRLKESQLTKLIRHEIGCHVLRYEGGLLQSEPLLSIGTRRGILIEEGVAIAMEDPTGPPRIFLRHFTVSYAKDHSFRETWEALREKGIRPKRAWQFTLRAKRGLSDGSSHGGFTRDALYAQGFEDISEYQAKGNDLTLLLSAPVHFDEMPLLIKHGGFVVTPIAQNYLSRL